MKFETTDKKNIWIGTTDFQTEAKIASGNVAFYFSFICLGIGLGNLDNIGVALIYCTSAVIIMYLIHKFDFFQTQAEYIAYKLNPKNNN